MDIAIQQTTKEIDRILKRNRLTWEDLIRNYRKRNIWQEVKGIWAKKKIGPLRYERKIRKELDISSR